MQDENQPTPPRPKPAIADEHWEVPGMVPAPIIMGRGTPSDVSLAHSWRIRWPLLVGLAVIGLVVMYQWQHGQVTSLKKQLSGVQQTATELRQQNASLQQQVVTLEQEVNLKPTSSTGPTTTVGGSSDITAALDYGKQVQAATLPLDNGTITVMSALYAERFGNSAYNGEAALLQVTVHNTTTSDQTYDLRNLTLQLPNGTVEKFGDIYNSVENVPTVTVAAAGNTEVIITFSQLTTNATPGVGYLRYTPVTAGITKVAVNFKQPLN